MHSFTYNDVEVTLESAAFNSEFGYIFNISVRSMADQKMELRASDFYVFDGDDNKSPLVYFSSDYHYEDELASIEVEPAEMINVSLVSSDFEITSPYIDIIYAPNRTNEFGWHVELLDIAWSSEDAAADVELEPAVNGFDQQLEIAKQVIAGKEYEIFYSLSDTIYLNAIDAYFLITDIAMTQHYKDGTPALRMQFNLDSESNTSINPAIFTLVDSYGNVYTPSTRSFSELTRNLNYINAKYDGFTLYYENAPASGSYSLLIYDGLNKYYGWYFEI